MKLSDLPAGFRKIAEDQIRREDGECPKRIEIKSQYRSKYEALYAGELEIKKRAKLIDDWKYERVVLVIDDTDPKRKRRYKSDFATWFNGRLTLHEVKGFWREKDRLRWEWAAQQFPHIEFVAVMREGNGWKYEYRNRRSRVYI